MILNYFSCFWLYLCGAKSTWANAFVRDWKFAHVWFKVPQEFMPKYGTSRKLTLQQEQKSVKIDYVS